MKTTTLLNGSHMKVECKKLRAVLNQLDIAGIEYVLVGETPEELLEYIDGDVDIVLRRPAIDEIHAIIALLCEKLDMQCIQVLQHEQRAFCFVVTWLEAGDRYYQKLDFCDDYLRNARTFLTADELLDGRIKEVVSGFYIPLAEKNLLYYLLKKIDKGAVDETQYEYLLRNFALCRQGILPELCRFWSEALSRKVFQALDGKDLDGFRNVIPELRRVLRRRSNPSATGLVREFLRVAKRFLYPTGVYIAVCGAGGCGNKEVIDDLTSSLFPAFRREMRLHLVHPGDLFKIILAKTRSALILFDGYSVGRIGASFFVPKPDLIFYLDANRVVECSVKEKESSGWRRRFRNSDMNDAFEPAENVVHAMQSIVLEFMNNRIKSRNG